MKLLKPILIPGLLVATLALVSCGGDGNKQMVFTEKSQKRTIVEVVSANGKVQPVNEVKISPDVPGEIIELNVKEGQEVKKGQMLVKINPDLYVSTVDRMEATLNGQKSSLSNAKSRLTQANITFKNVEANYKRNENLFKQKAISASEFDAIQAQYDNAKADIDVAKDNIAAAEFSVKSAEASLKEAKDNLNRTTIYAPVDGTVSKLTSRKGERVVGTSQMAGTEMLRIADLTAMEVQVDVNENDIIRIHMNDTADIEIDAYGDRKFKGIVTEISNSANTTGLTADQVTNFPVKILILRSSYEDLMKDRKENESPFRPGMTASVDIKTKVVTNVVSVPIQSVTTSVGQGDAPAGDGEDGEGPPPESQVTDSKDKKKDEADKPKEVVYIFDNGKAKMVEVKTGVQDNNYIEIISGVKDGQEIIAGPYRVVSKQLKDGAEVEKKPKDFFNTVKTD